MRLLLILPFLFLNVAFAEGEPNTAAAEGKPNTAAAEGKPNIVQPVAEWLLLPEVNTPDSPLAKNVESAWEKGCERYGFTAADLPLTAGTIEHKIVEGVSVTVAGKWSHDSEVGRCYMNIVLKPDGAFGASRGGCIPNR